MENRIPIDELFRDKLGQGKEQMNLGAWANMERMIDGKNPYAEEDGKKNRRFLPFIWLLLITTGIVGAGYLVNSKMNGKAESKNETVEHNINNQDNSPSFSKVDNFIQAQSNDLNESSNLSSSQESLNNSNKNLSNQLAASQNNSPVKNDNKTDELLNNANSNNNNKRSDITNQSSINQVNSKSSRDSKLTHNLKESKSKSNSTISKLSKEDKNPLTGTSTKSFTGDQLLASQSQSGSIFQSKPDLNSTSNLEPEVKMNKVVEKMPMVTINQKTTRNRDGSVKKVSGDTIGISTYEKVTEYPVNEQVTASLDLMVSNPRFKKLSEEEELNARLEQKYEPKVSNTISAEPSVMQVKSNVSIASNQKILYATKKQTGYFEDLKKFAIDTYRKISNFMVYSPKPQMHLGMMMGVNASLSNSKNNFGGFQAGLTTITPISDYFSFLGEFKFFYRNNGGFTVNDISYNVLNYTKDENLITHNTIHSYTKDSTVKTYNFKNFYSLELPLMIQLNSRSFGFYSGINLAYNFKLKTSNKTKNYIVDYHDTLPSSMPFTLPIEKGSIVHNDDFSSRFGLGYTVGASYNFSPKLGLDIRITQNVWDNAKTVSSRDISKGFFKVPSIQISLAYKFRDFIPNY